MFKVLKALALILVFALLAARVHAAPSFMAGFNTGAIYTDSSANHYAMGPVGSGPNSITLAPQVIEGTGAVQGFTDSNYITVTTASLTGITTQGSIMVHWNRGNGVGFGSSTDSVLLGINTTSNGNFFVLVGPNGSNNNDVRFPTTGGYVQVPFTYAWITGRSYEIIFSWNGTAYQVNIAEDQPTRTYTTALSSTAAATISFASPTAVYIGRDTLATGYYTPAIIDAVAFYSTAMTTDPGDFTYNIPYRVMWRGDSRPTGTVGTLGNCDTTGGDADGWRYAFDIDRDFNGFPVIMVGPTAQTGQRYTNLYDPFTAGVPGSTMTGVTTTAPADLSTYMPNGTTHDYVFVLCEINDCYNNVTLTTFVSQLETLDDQVNSASPNIGLVYITAQPNTGYCAADMQYINAVDTAYFYELSHGRRVFLADLQNLSAYGVCQASDPHTNVSGYDIIGHGLYAMLAAGLPSPTPTFTASPTITNTYTVSPTPTFTITHTFTVSPTSTYTNSPTHTNTFTASPTVTNTPTMSPTATFTASSTATPTPTRTETPACLNEGNLTPFQTPGYPVTWKLLLKPVTIPSGDDFLMATVYVSKAQGKISAGLYAAGSPATLVCHSPLYTATLGWNQIPIFGYTPLTQTSYLLAVLGSAPVRVGAVATGPDEYTVNQVPYWPWSVTPVAAGANYSVYGVFCHP